MRISPNTISNTIEISKNISFKSGIGQLKRLVRSDQETSMIYDDVISATCTEIYENDDIFHLCPVPYMKEGAIQAKIEMFNFLKGEKEHLGEDYKDAIQALIGVDKYTLDFAKQLVLDKDFPKSALNSVICKIRRPENIKYVSEMVDFIKDNKEHLSDGFEASMCLAGYANDINIVLLRYMVLDKDFPREEIPNIVCCSVLFDRNKQFAFKLIQDPDFPKNKIGKSIFSIGSEESKAKEEFYDYINEHKNEFQSDYPFLADAIEHINENNLNLAYFVLQNKEMPKRTLPGILEASSK